MSPDVGTIADDPSGNDTCACEVNTPCQGILSKNDGMIATVLSGSTCFHRENAPVRDPSNDRNVSLRKDFSRIWSDCRQLDKSGRVFDFSITYLMRETSAV